MFTSLLLAEKRRSLHRSSHLSCPETQCYRQAFVARGLCTAAGKPRRRKNGAGIKATQEIVPSTAEIATPAEASKPSVKAKKLPKATSSTACNPSSTSAPLPLTAEIATPSEATKSSVKNRKLPKPSSSTASNPISTSVPLKEVPVAVKQDKKPNVPPQMSSEELSSLLSLDEADDVSTYPVLKFTDFSIPLTEVDSSAVSSPSRYLTALRLCHKFSHGCAFIRHQLFKLSGQAVLEAARLLADTELRRRCTMRLKLKLDENPEDIATLSRDLLERFKSTRLPPSMAVAINVLLGCMIEPVRTVNETSLDEMKQMIFRAEVHHHLACTALDFDLWDKFKCIMSSCPLSPHYSPILVFHITNFILRNPVRASHSKLSPLVSLFSTKNSRNDRKEVLKWYLSALSLERKPLNQLQWSKYAANIIRVCGTKAEPVVVTRSGMIENSTGKNQQLSLPKEDPINEQDFLCLKNDLNSLLSELSKGSGSVTRKEVATLRKCIQSWSKGNSERAVVIDSLNVFHGKTYAFDPLVKLTNRLAAEYDNAVLVTRPFLAEKLKFVRWRGNVRVFSCSTLSEDDLLVLLAAVEWGPNAYVLSNDRFGVHVERANCTGRLSLEEWMRRRILRFDRVHWNYDALPEYGEFVQEVTPNTFFVPISEETPGIPRRSARLVTL
ncbi:hypothetical protein COOONC_21782 [Cooperia oncophora]